MKGETSGSMAAKLKIDEIGYWTEIKLSILEKYATLHQILLSHSLHPIYIDGFAGAGHHKSKGSGRIIEGSPLRALAVDPPFERFHFVDIDGTRVAELKRISAGRSNVTVYQGDCNAVLTEQVFPTISYANRQRALCILDPYGLQLNWKTIRMAGESQIIEIFLNFPVMDMNMNVLWHDSDRVTEVQRERLNILQTVGRRSEKTCGAGVGWADIRRVSSPNQQSPRTHGNRIAVGERDPQRIRDFSIGASANPGLARRCRARQRHPVHDRSR
jgi:hypothetical protein